MKLYPVEKKMMMSKPENNAKKNLCTQRRTFMKTESENEKQAATGDDTAELGWGQP